MPPLGGGMEIIMKKFHFFIILGIFLSLTACGSKATSENPIEETSTKTIEETLISTDWKAVLSSYESSMDFNEDGTGTIMYEEDSSGSDMSWKLSGESTIKIEYESGSKKKYYYNLAFTQNGTSIRLTDMSEGMILVPSENFDTETSAIKQERVESAKELDWSTAHDVYVDNPAKFEEEYARQIWKWTATVYQSESGYCQMASEKVDGFPLNSINVYMDNSELMKVNSGSTITVIGFLENSSQMTNAFVVE